MRGTAVLSSVGPGLSRFVRTFKLDHFFPRRV